MSEEVQIFWDPYLEAFIIEIPSRNRSSSATPPIVVTPDDFQAPPTRTTAFVMDPNAPLGSFHNPIPHPSEPVNTALVPMPMITSGPASQARLLWPPTNTGPLGSFQNPFPHEASTAPGNTSCSSPPVLAPTSPSTPAQPHAATPEQGWRPTATEIEALFGTPSPHPLPHKEAPPHPIRGGPQPTERTATEPVEKPSTRTPGARHVHFQGEEDRQRANEDAAARAAAQARQNEAEVLGFTDLNAADRLGSTHRRPPTPKPSATGQVASSTSSPSTTRPLQPESRSSSTSSFIDPLPTSGEYKYERWPLCAVCENRPVMIRKSGTGFCDACFGQACAAEELRKRGDRRR
ncbi:MAG: hypothetical protein L6R39_002376 [Caloplaca ligustica]|nr:MAG: hypothetical protein L6R39_002376 [Caloplaca ligustica]